LKQFEADLNILRKAAGIQRHDLGVLCCDAPYMQQLQRDIGDSITSRVPSVMSFPYNEKSLYWTRGSMPEPKVEWNLGDIVLSIPTIFDDSKRHYLNLYSAMAMVSAQGISELLVEGNHDSIDHHRKLLDKECEILDQYNRLTGAKLPLPDGPSNSHVAAAAKQ